MSLLKLTSANLPHSVQCPTSKSYAARALILAALSKETKILTNIPLAQDTKDLIRCLKEIGLDIQLEEENRRVEISNSFPACEKNTSQRGLNLGEGGTTIRFLIPLLALGKCKYNLSYEGRMLERPMREFYKALEDMGVVIKQLDTGVEIQGPFNFSKTTSIDCSRSSQFASGLEMVKNFYPLNLEYKKLVLSKKYFEMTQALVRKFKLESRYEIPADFSCLGYFIAYAIFTQDLVITNLREIDPYQADSVLISILKQMGASISFNSLEGLKVLKTQKLLKPLSVDGSKCIDLVPTLSFIAAHVCGKSEISNIKGLVHKESDRLLEILRILKAFKVHHEYSTKKDLLTIFGKNVSDYKNELYLDYNPPKDHRMVMIACLFIKIRGGGTVSNISSVDKSFPQFFNFFH